MAEAGAGGRRPIVNCQTGRAARQLGARRGKAGSVRVSRAMILWRRLGRWSRPSLAGVAADEDTVAGVIHCRCQRPRGWRRLDLQWAGRPSPPDQERTFQVIRRGGPGPARSWASRSPRWSLRKLAGISPPL